MIYKLRFQDVTFADIEELKTVGHKEDDQTEYKKTYGFLNASTPGDKKDQARAEFAKDVAAFANKDGGCLIIGVSETRAATPDDVVGIDSSDPPDVIERQLRGILASKVDPKFAPDIRIRFIASSNQSVRVIVIRVEPSLRAPRQLAEARTFPVRRGPMVETMTVRELQEAFLISERWAERIKRFREDRLKNLEPMQRIGRLREGIGLVAHLVPFGNLRRQESFDLREVNKCTFSMPIGTDGTVPFTKQFNADGLAAATPNSCAVQVFRDGSIELALGVEYLLNEEEDSSKARLFLRSAEDSVRLFARDFPTLCSAAGARFPFSLSASLVNLSGRSAMPYDADDQMRLRKRERIVLDRSRVDLVDVVLETAEGDATATLRPTFDSLWQCFGYEGSPSYDPTTSAWRRLERRAQRPPWGGTEAIFWLWRQGYVRRS